MTLVTEAVIFAAQAHDGAARKGSMIPYIVHPMEVVAICATLTDDQQVLAAAALHDVMEDCGVGFDELSRRFGVRVAKLVCQESQQYCGDPCQTWNRRKLGAVRRIHAGCRETKIIALGDKLSNMRAISRGNIGIVQQDVFLFAGTILENIRYGRPSATMEEVVEAAKMAEIHDDIMAMPDGYETIVGERGIMLSGGQKQRVSIARIFLKNPRVLILDEATSALDTATERKIQAAFDRLAKGRTTLVIAHRLSTIRNADEIVVVGEHGILEKGTHAQLVRQGGIYAELAAGASLSGETME